MDKVAIVERLRTIYENIEHLLSSDERYDLEDLIDKIEQDVVRIEQGLGSDEEEG
jgi:hypothetical protein